jgi:hypothetical protein
MISRVRISPLPVFSMTLEIRTREIMPADRDDHPAAGFKLLDQRGRRFFRGGRDKNPVEWRMFGPAARTVADTHLNFIAENVEAGLGGLSEFFDHLDAEDLGAHLRHDRGLVSEACAHFENACPSLDAEQVDHEGADERLRYCLVEADRQRRVLIGHQHQALRDEQVSRNVHERAP